MSNKAHYFALSNGDNVYYDFADETINFEIEQASLAACDPRHDEIMGSFLSIKADSEVGRILRGLLEKYEGPQ